MFFVCGGYFNWILLVGILCVLTVGTGLVDYLYAAEFYPNRQQWLPPVGHILAMMAVTTSVGILHRAILQNNRLEEMSWALCAYTETATADEKRRLATVFYPELFGDGPVPPGDSPWTCRADEMNSFGRAVREAAEAHRNK